jgi:PEP-CTERM motif
VAIAQAGATGGEYLSYNGNGGADATSTAKSTFTVANVRSTDEAEEAANSYPSIDTLTTNSVAQAGGSGQSFVKTENSAYAFSIILPDKAEVATLIGDVSTVASAFLGPKDIVFGTSTLGINGYPDEPVQSFTFSESSTFDFTYRGDLLLGLIDSVGDLSVIINGGQILAADFVADSVINLGSGFGPNIDLKIVLEGSGDFVLGRAVPEPSTWAMMLVGFAGLGFAGYRSTQRRAAVRLRA